jgi:hypothetical protein
MQFFCNTGYSVESCRAHLAALRRVLAPVNVAALGEWTWVLVRSEDWRQILRRVGRDPDSPAFTILEKRQTFLEEALFVPMGERSATLLAKFRLPLDLLLEHAVLHELGHAISGERDESRAHNYATQLRQRAVVPTLAAAVALLPAEDHPAVPVVLLDAKTGAQRLLQLTKGRCAAVLRPSASAVFVRTDCQVYQQARDGDTLALRMLAAVLAHEQAHVAGDDEAAALNVERECFQRLVPWHELSPSDFRRADAHRAGLASRAAMNR